MRAAATPRWPGCSPGRASMRSSSPSDVVALGAIGALREAGLRVPADVSVVGFDDIPLAALLRSTPHHRPAAGLRARAGRRTSARATDRRPGRSVTGRCFPPSSSCAPRQPVRGRYRPARAEPRTCDPRLVADRGARQLEPERSNERMEDRMFRPNRVAGILAVVAIVATACSSGRAARPPRPHACRSATGGAASASTPASAAASAEASASASTGARQPRPQAPRPLLRGASAGASPNIGGEVTVNGTWTGDEQDAFLAMVEPWERARRASRSTTPGQRDLNTVLTTGVASGVQPPGRRRPAGPGPDGAVDRTASSPSTSSTTTTSTYTSETAAPLVELGTVDGKLVGIFIKGAVKGLIWYNPKTMDIGSVRTDDLGRPQDAPPPPQATGRHQGGASASSPAPTPAGPAPTGSRTSSSARPAPTSTTRGGRASQVDVDPRSRRRSRRSATPSPNSVRRRAGPSTRTNFGKAATRCSRRPPAACSTTRRASSPASALQDAPKARRPTTTSSRSPTSTPPYAGTVDGGGDLFGMFNDTPAGQVADGQYLLTAAGPGHLGQARRRHSRPTRTPIDPIPTTSASGPPRSWPTRRPSGSMRPT